MKLRAFLRTWSAQLGGNAIPNGNTYRIASVVGMIDIVNGRKAANFDYQSIIYVGVGENAWKMKQIVI